MRLSNKAKAELREAGKFALLLVCIFAVCILFADGLIMVN